MKVKVPPTRTKHQRSIQPSKQKHHKASVKDTTLKVNQDQLMSQKDRRLTADSSGVRDACEQPSSTLQTRPKITKSAGEPFLQGFDSAHIDLCTNKTFSTLMQEKFSDKRPYCFASVVIDGGMSARRHFLDGKSIIIGHDEKPSVGSIPTLVKGNVINLSDIHFFCAREGRSVELLGSLTNLKRSPYFFHFQQMITQEESNPNTPNYRTERAEVDLTISLLFGAGIGVSADPTYADLLLHRIDPTLTPVILAQEFSGIATIRSDIRLAKQLLNVGADPKIPDPDDDYSAVDVAQKHDNRLLLDFFRKKGIL